MLESTVFLGTFNSEKYWRSPTLSQLPNITDPQTEYIIEAMDELLFIFCKKEDTLVTKYPVNPAFIDYHERRGRVLTNIFLSKAFNDNEEKEKDIEKCLCEGIGSADFVKLTPYAVTSYVSGLVTELKVSNKLPCHKIVSTVNSKAFSTRFADQYGKAYGGQVISSAEELLIAGARMLEIYPKILIKDTFGVAGKGNLIIKDKLMLRSIFRVLNVQEAKGMTSEFVLEPYLNREIDFSCQFYVNIDRSWKLGSIHIMFNKGLSFSAMEEADPGFIRILDEKKYFETVDAVAGQLVQAGYFGPVCLDSMFLSDGTLIPIIEINARFSMGFFNKEVNDQLDAPNLKSRLINYNLGLKVPIAFEVLLDAMAKKEILYKEGKKSGFIPLSANTFDINCCIALLQNHNFRMLKGRLYASLIYEYPEDIRKLDDQLQQIFLQLGIQILS